MTSRSSARTTRNRATGRRCPERSPLAWAAMKPTTQGVTMNAAAAALTDERVLIDHSPPAVAAHDVARRYGEGDTAVDALRGVSLQVPDRQLTAVMGSSGSGKSTLMHILAGLDQPTSGSVEIAGVEITSLKDNDLTKLRRQHIGFVFQFFNLLPMLTAEENVVLPLTIAGRRPERAWLEQLLDSAGLPADGPFRRRADREPRLGHERRDPRARPALGRRARPDDRDGHPRRIGRDDRRPRPLPRGRSDRQVSRPALAGPGDRRDPGGGRTMTGVALRGLLARRVRAVLTALAIVLGVAMVSGSFVLTDTISKAFDTI